MHACRFIVHARNVAYLLDVVRGNIVLRLRSILGYNTEILRMRIHTHVVAIPLHKNIQHQLTPHPLLHYLITNNYLKTTIHYTTS